MSSRRKFSVARVFSQLLHLVFPALLIVSITARADGQATTLRDGMRVLVSTPASKKIVGTVKSIDRDSVSLYSGENGARLAVANSDIRSIRVSQGRSAWAGAKRGAMWGAGVGAALAAALVPFAKPGNSDDSDINELRLAATTQLVMGGLIWGAGIGAFVKREQWEAVSIGPAVSPTSSGVGFSITSRLLH
jgi:hypothetical protein